jgi:hypothetical protein
MLLCWMHVKSGQAGLAAFQAVIPNQGQDCIIQIELGTLGPPTGQEATLALFVFPFPAE